MFLVKFTILFWVISELGFRWFAAYLRNNPLAGIAWKVNKNSKSHYVVGLLTLTRWALLIASLIWFLFLR